MGVQPTVLCKEVPVLSRHLYPELCSSVPSPSSVLVCIVWGHHEVPATLGRFALNSVAKCLQEKVQHGLGVTI